MIILVWVSSPHTPPIHYDGHEGPEIWKQISFSSGKCPCIFYSVAISFPTNLLILPFGNLLIECQASQTDSRISIYFSPFSFTFKRYPQFIFQHFTECFLSCPILISKMIVSLISSMKFHFINRFTSYFTL